MLSIVPEEESRRWRAEMEALYKSEKLEDRIVAILMDLDIGHSGHGGNGARAKAKAICELIKK